MKLYTGADFARVIAALQANPQSVLALLQQMQRENSVDKCPFTFGVNFDGVQFANPAAGASAAGSFGVDASSAFVLIGQTYWATAADAAVTVSTAVAPNNSIQINDSNNSRNWQDRAIPVANCFGSAQQPFFLPEPRVMPPNTTITVINTNFDAAVARIVRLAFFGFRLYPAGAAQG